MGAGIIRKCISFSGRVQGVGFRYKAVWAAREAGVTGWVQNLWDGTVLMEVQGQEAAIDRVVMLLNQDRYIRIDRMDVKSIPVEENESSFRVH